MTPGTRAVLLKWAPTTHICEACNKPILAEKGRRRAVCCNIYENGRWARVEHFHPACYDGRHGPVIDRGTLPPKSRTSWTYA
jgi:hypothetical protein